jgi:hypothetical protein
VADRVGVSHLSQNELSTIMGRRSQTRPATIPSETSETTAHMLINQDRVDGCWDELYMIAGGTGIAPMVQVCPLSFSPRMQRNFHCCSNRCYRYLLIVTCS